MARSPNRGASEYVGITVFIANARMVVKDLEITAKRAIEVRRTARPANLPTETSGIGPNSAWNTVTQKGNRPHAMQMLQRSWAST